MTETTKTTTRFTEPVKLSMNEIRSEPRDLVPRNPGYERWHGTRGYDRLEVTKRVEKGDLVTAMLWINGVLFRQQFTAGEHLEPAQPCVPHPVFPSLLFMEQPIVR